MSDNEPLVSIMIPCYNHEKFIRDCLSSIISQKYSNIELIICDDASQDESWKIITSQYPALNQRLSRVIQMKNDQNMGMTVTLNRMLRVAKGEFVKVLASDDALRPECISTFINEFSDDDNTGVMICNGTIIRERDHFPFTAEYDRVYKEIPFAYNEKMLEQVYKENILFAPGAMVRRKIYEQYGFYDESIQIEDWELWLRILSQSTVKFRYIDKELVYYRKSDNSMTSMVRNASLEKRRVLLHKSEMSILMKYGKYVSKEIEAYQLINRIVSEQALAYRNGYPELLQLTGNEIREYRMWTKLSFSDLKEILYRMIVMKRKKIPDNNVE